MWQKIKKIISSKIFLSLISLILIYFAFKKVDINVILLELGKVPLWFVLFNLIYQFVVLLLIAYRWTILVFEKPTLRDAWNFVRAIYVGMFYSLFFPSSGTAIDAVKWVPLIKRYPNLSKSFLLGTMVLDRTLTIMAFYTMALVSLMIAIFFGFKFPIYLLWIIISLFVIFGIILFLLLSGKSNKLFKKINYFNNIKEVNSLLKNKNRIIKCVLIGLVTESLWLLPVWFISNVFNSGFSLLSVYVFYPLITTVLILPISFSGFGAREQLYLYFFGQLGLVDEKILLVSTFFGMIGVVSCLMGGIFTFSYSRSKLK